MTEPNYYELLGVMRNAPPEVILSSRWRLYGEHFIDVLGQIV